MKHDSKLAVVSSCIKPSYVLDIKDLLDRYWFISMSGKQIRD